MSHRSGPDHSGTHLAGSGFAGDQGAADPSLAAALAAYEEDRSRYGQALARLCSARLLVPVVAVAGETPSDQPGNQSQQTSDMAAVLLHGRDGRAGLLAFTGTESLAGWDPDARPVPVMAADAAVAAGHDGAAALVVDVAGPVRFVVEGEDLEMLAQGHRLVQVGAGYGWIRPGHG